MKKKHYIIWVILISSLLIFTGCNFFEKANNLKDDLLNITMDQIAFQLENSLNQELPGLQVDSPELLTPDGQPDWEALKNSELANYVFYSFGDYEFRAVLVGDGVFKIERINYATGETYAYAEFQVEMVDGKFKVNAK